jgi:hypothetical protein
MKKVNYKSASYKVKRAIPAQEGALLQNRIMQYINELGAVFSPVPMNDNGVAQVRYGDADYTDIPPTIACSRDFMDADNLNGLSAILHEIGHVIDYKKAGSSFREYIKSGGTHEIEIRAWEYAFQIANRFGFKEFDYMYEDALSSLWTYFGTEGTPLPNHRDRLCGYHGRRPNWTEAQERIYKAYKEAKEKRSKLLLGL